MKVFIFLLLATFLTSCDGCDNDPPPKTEIEKLPPATQEGKNTFGCLVNGKAWVTKTSIDANAVYQLGALLVTGQIQETTGLQNIQLNILENVIANQQYDLTDDPKYHGKFAWSRDEGICFYEGENTLSGQLTLTKFDQSNRIASGVFEFITVVSGCDTIRITDGRFDLIYSD